MEFRHLEDAQSNVLDVDSQPKEPYSEIFPHKSKQVSMVLDTDEDLPWDPIWAYVLGEEEDHRRGIRRKTKNSPSEEGLISYIKDVMPASESRDDDWLGGRSDGKASKEGTRKKGFIWRRNNAAEEARSNDTWEWYISTGSSYDDVVSSDHQTRGIERLRGSPPTQEKKGKLAQNNERNFKKKQASGKDSWEWKIANDDKKDKRMFGRFNRNKEPDKWDFMTTTSQEKGVRRVRFSRSSSNNDESWIDTKEVIAQLERSQTTLFDWVGINPSCDEDDPTHTSQRKKQGPISVTSKEKKQKMSDSTTLSDSGNLFGDFFASFVDDNLDSSDDESSSQSSTEDSSAGTVEEECLSDDDSRSLPTLQSDATPSQTQQVKDSIVLPHLRQRDVNEVRLSFQPISQDEIYTNHLPVIDEENSEDELKITAINRGESITAKNLELVGPIETKGEPQNDLTSSINVQPHATGRRLCCSVKNLPYEELKWSEETGIPFHELSLEEQSSLKPKIDALADEHHFAHSAALVDPQISSKFVPTKNRTVLSQKDQHSSFKYDCNTSVQMFVTYDRFGSNALRVITAPAPKKTRFDSILVKVEASTVSCTDVAIRQGCLLNKSKLTLPNTPGIDVVGRVCRVNAETSQRYGFKVGDRIISLVKSGGNSRYMSVNPLHAVIVPESLDPVATVCLAETYLTAFQMLHNGQAQRIRYRDDSLKGKTILLRGFGISGMGQAIAQLALQAGANNVSASAEANLFGYLTNIGISPIDTGLHDWENDKMEKIDIIISSDEDCADIPSKLLKGNGRVIILKSISKRGGKDSSAKLRKGILSCLQSAVQQYRMTLYNIHEEWDKNLDCCKLDLQHLIHLMENRKVIPNVLDRVSLGQVAKAQELVASKQQSGFIVCEPWLLEKSKTICL